jgi:alanine racemase
VAPAACAAVVKADAYGLGADRVAPALAAAGCRTFFVACIDEGIALRAFLEDGDIYVLAGAPRGAEGEFARHRLRPALNSLPDLDAWAAFARSAAAAPAVALHADTGMRRLGLTPEELALLAEAPDRLAGVKVACIMSHLACADLPDHPLNETQCAAFADLRRLFPNARASLAASSGIFLGPAYHGTLCRPGAALYGISPVPEQPNPMTQVVELKARILQVRAIDGGESVGYGATYRASRRERLVTVGVGYADGYLRSLSNRGHGYIRDIRMPLVGRVSMDLTVFDASAVPDEHARPGSIVELIGPHHPVDAVAADAGTIGYEILTNLGRRYHRLYRGGEPAAAEA